MTLLFFGDSFTAGAELLDHLHYDDYPKPVSLNDQKSNQIEAWKNKNKPLIQLMDKKKFDVLRKEQKKHTYAQKLADLMQVPHHNMAVGGSSLHKTRYLLTKSLTKLTDPVTIFVQPTAPERWMDYVNNQWMDFIPGNSYQGVALAYFKSKVSNNTDYSRFCSWLLELQGIFDHCSTSDMVKKFYFINSGELNYVDNNKDKFGDLLPAYESIKHKIRDITFHFPHLKDNKAKNFLPWGHVTELNHEQLAIDIHRVLCYNKK
jgi:hypothetical protein